MAPAETYLYLTTTGRRTGKPRTIEIWFVERGGTYYVVSYLWERANWFRNLVADPAVWISIGTREDRQSVLTRTRAIARVLAEDPEVSALMDAKYDWSDGRIVELELAAS
jgi:deazaflavin-dependent oxidoreductase (nitroreductase family)